MCAYDSMAARNEPDWEEQLSHITSTLSTIRECVDPDWFAEHFTRYFDLVLSDQVDRKFSGGAALKAVKEATDTYALPAAKKIEEEFGKVEVGAGRTWRQAFCQVRSTSPHGLILSCFSCPSNVLVPVPSISSIQYKFARPSLRALLNRDFCSFLPKCVLSKALPAVRSTVLSVDGDDPVLTFNVFSLLREMFRDSGTKEDEFYATFEHCLPSWTETVKEKARTQVEKVLEIERARRQAKQVDNLLLLLLLPILLLWHSYLTYLYLHLLAGFGRQRRRH